MEIDAGAPLDSKLAGGHGVPSTGCNLVEGYAYGGVVQNFVETGGCLELVPLLVFEVWLVVDELVAIASVGKELPDVGNESGEVARRLVEQALHGKRRRRDRAKASTTLRQRAQRRLPAEICMPQAQKDPLFDCGLAFVVLFAMKAAPGE